MCADFASELLTLVRRCDDTVSISPLKRKMCLKSPIRKTKIINSISICRNWFSNVFIKFYDSERFVTRFNKTPTCWNKLKIERKQQTIYSKGNCILSVYGKRMYKKRLLDFESPYYVQQKGAVNLYAHFGPLNNNENITETF